MNERDRKLPDSAFNARESFINREGEVRNPDYEYEVEETFVNATRILLREDPMLYEEILEEDVPVNPQLAQTAAFIESAALQWHAPAITSLLTQSTTLYRLLREAELKGEITRGGNNLLIGSGLTTPEYLALQVIPPSPERIFRLVDSDESLKERIAKVKTFTDRSVYENPEYYPGNTYAVEPNADDFKEFKDLYQRLFSIPEGSIHLTERTLGEAIENELLPTDVDTILINRADPEVFISGSKADEQMPRQQRRQLKRVRKKSDLRDLTTLFSRLSEAIRPDGNFIVTVGHGNTPSEMELRKTFLNDLRGILPTLGFTIEGNKPRFYTTPAEKYFYTGIYGSIGSLIARKVR